MRIPKPIRRKINGIPWKNIFTRLRIMRVILQKLGNPERGLTMRVSCTTWEKAIRDFKDISSAATNWTIQIMTRAASIIPQQEPHAPKTASSRSDAYSPI